MTTKRARIQAALAGDSADRVPVAFWRHWPGDDQDAARLAEVTLAFDRRFDWDFAKVTPSSSYSVEGWGAQTQLVGVPLGERTHVRRVIQRGADWLTIQPLAPSTDALARTLETIRLVRAALGPDTPLLMTVFNPLGVARYLAGDELFLAHLRIYRREVRAALDAITATYQQYVAAAIEAGADGIFFSTSTAAHSVMSEAEYRELGVRDDLRVLEAAEGGWFNVLHLHSPFPMLPLAREYPCQAVNWDDRTSEPSLGQGKQILGGKTVIGGINQWGTLQQGTYEQVHDEAREAIVACGGRGMILGAGCTYPVTVPEGNLLAARRAVEAA